MSTASLPCEGKLFLAFLCYVSREESISKVYCIMIHSQLMAEGIQNVCYTGDSSKQRGCDFIQFPVILGHMPEAIWLFHWPHQGIKRTMSGLYDAHLLQIPQIFSSIPMAPVQFVLLSICYLPRYRESYMLVLLMSPQKCLYHMYPWSELT